MTSAPEIVDEIAVRMELVNACALAGSREAFAEQHRVFPEQLDDFIHGRRRVPSHIIKAIGFERVVRYRKSPFASGTGHRPGNSPSTNGAFSSS